MMSEFDKWAAKKYPNASRKDSLGAFSRDLMKSAREGWDAHAELATLKAGQGEAVAYAYEYGKDNGDGSFSVTITRGQIPSYLTPVKDWPVKPLYLSPPASADAVPVPRELLEHSAQFIERHSFFQFGDPVTPDAAVGRSLSDQLRALLAQSESKGVK